MLSLLTSLALTVFGWLVSLYFLLVYKRRLSSQAAWMPKPVRMTGAACTEIVDSSYGRVLGQPNAFWGLLYFPGLALILLGNYYMSLPSDFIVLAAITASFALSLYLLRGLYVLKVRCRPCLTTHGINSLLLVLAIINYFST